MIRAIVDVPKRGSDAWGSGELGARRGDRTHRGIDYAVEPGTTIVSPAVGTVSKLGFCYSDDLFYRYVQITDSDNFRHRVFYVEPGVKVGDWVNLESAIGDAQNIALRYTTRLSYMKNHVHYEVMHGDAYLNPVTLEELDP